MSDLYENKQIVWLPKELADKIAVHNDPKSVENEILKYIGDFRQNLKLDLDGLDDSVLQYKASMIKAKQAFREACDQNIKEFENIWDTYHDDLATVRDKATQMVNAIRPVKEEIASLNNELGKINMWNIESLLKVIKEVSNYLGYNSDTGKVLKFLFENYKRPSE